MILFDCYYYTGWWFGTWFFPFSWEFNHPNWRTHIFQRGRYTTNHLLTSYNNYWYIVRITMFIIIITIIIVIIIPTSQKRNLPSSTWHRWGPTFSSAKGGVPGKDGRPPTKEGTIKIKKDDWWAILPSRNWWIMISLPFVKVNTWSLMWMFTRKTMMIWPPKMGVTNWWKSLMLLRWRLWSDLPQFMIKLRWRVGQRGWFLTMNGNIFVRPSHTFQKKSWPQAQKRSYFSFPKNGGMPQFLAISVVGNMMQFTWIFGVSVDVRPSTLEWAVINPSITGWWFGTCFILFLFFHSVGNFIIPTDEIHHFSEG